MLGFVEVICMLRIGPALVGAVAVLAVCVVSSSSALAAGQWYISALKFTGEEAVEETWGLADLESSIDGVNWILTCSVGSATGTIKESSKDTTSALKFTGCKFAEPSGCTPGYEIQWVSTKTELEVSGGKVFDKYVPESGETFTTFVIEGCPLEGVYKVSGSLRCEVKSPNTEAVEKECVFNKESGSKVKFNGEADFLATFKIKLTGTSKGKVWSAKTS